MIEGLSKFVIPQVANEKVLERMRRIRVESGTPAVAALVIEKNQVLFSAHEGVRKLGESTRVGAEDRWHLGSCTKNLTAFQVGVLVDRGLLRWTERLRELVPSDFSLHPDLSEVTVEMLLAHQGGFIDLTLLAGGQLWPRLFDQRAGAVEARDLLVRALLTEAPLFQPGTQSQYSNAGYLVLGWLIERRLRRSWEEATLDLLRERWGIRSAGFGAPACEAAPSPDQPWAHFDDEGTLVPVHGDNPAALGPAGTLHCTLSDWALFLLEIERSARGEPRVLSKETAEKLFSRVPGTTMNLLSMGICEQRDWAQGPALTMAGSNVMNYFLTLIAPRRGRVILVATNSGRAATEQGMVELAKLLTTL